VFKVKVRTGLGLGLGSELGLRLRLRLGLRIRVRVRVRVRVRFKARDSSSGVRVCVCVGGGGGSSGFGVGFGRQKIRCLFGNRWVWGDKKNKKNGVSSVTNVKVRFRAQISPRRDNVRGHGAAEIEQPEVVRRIQGWKRRGDLVRVECAQGRWERRIPVPQQQGSRRRQSRRMRAIIGGYTPVMLCSAVHTHTHTHTRFLFCKWAV
jgi:hypothetical protein